VATKLFAQIEDHVNRGLLPDSINESSTIASPPSIMTYAYLDTGADVLIHPY
jgi:hypothetical protein